MLDVPSQGDVLVKRADSVKEHEAVNRPLAPNNAVSPRCIWQITIKTVHLCQEMTLHVSPITSLLPRPLDQLLSTSGMLTHPSMLESNFLGRDSQKSDGLTTIVSKTASKHHLLK